MVVLRSILLLLVLPPPSVGERRRGAILLGSIPGFDSTTLAEEEVVAPGSRWRVYCMSSFEKQDTHALSWPSRYETNRTMMLVAYDGQKNTGRLPLVCSSTSKHATHPNSPRQKTISHSLSRNSMLPFLCFPSMPALKQNDGPCLRSSPQEANTPLWSRLASPPSRRGYPGAAAARDSAWSQICHRRMGEEKRVVFVCVLVLGGVSPKNKQNF
jgi:hypothetical protein